MENEIVEFFDATITIAIFAALGWFVASGLKPGNSCVVIAILYTIGAPFDIISGRSASFWMSMILSLVYLRFYITYRKGRPRKEDRTSG
jgi:hypothetical protein